MSAICPPCGLPASRWYTSLSWGRAGACLLAFAKGGQIEVVVDQRGDGCADARAMVVQRRANRLQVARPNCRAKAEIGRQQGRALGQLLGILVQQAAPDPLTDLQFLCNLLARTLLNADPNDAENCCLHQEQKQQ